MYKIDRSIIPKIQFKIVLLKREHNILHMNSKYSVHILKKGKINMKVYTVIRPKVIYIYTNSI